MSSRIRYGAVGLIALLLLVNLVSRLASTPIAEWDEARHIASAIEMVHSHQYLVNTYEGQPDYWNAKPPLSMWAIAAGYELGGNPFLDVRLYSTLSLLMTLLLVYRQAGRESGAPAGMLAVLMLLTAACFIYRHGARTADADMLFTLLTTGCLFCCQRPSPWRLGLGYALLGLGFLAKSFHAAPFCLAAFVYSVLLWRQGVISLATVLLAPFAFLIPVLPWALARYGVDGSRFFDAMFFNDVLRRSTQDIIDDHGPTTPFLYLDKLSHAFAIPFICAVIALLRQWAPAPWRRPERYLLLVWILVPLLVYSLAATRLPWYAYPLFPAIAILLGQVLAETWAGLSEGARKGFVIAMVINLVANEAVILKRGHEARSQDPVAVAMMRMTLSPGQAGESIYLQRDTPDWHQHYYATALLMGATLVHGGVAAFERAPLATRPVLIHEDGSVQRRTTPQMAGR